VGWWPLDDALADFAGHNPGQPVGPIAFTTGKVADALGLDGTSAYVKVPASPGLNAGSSGTGLTLECRINPANINSLHPLIEWNNSAGSIGTHFFGGAYHYGCLATVIYCDSQSSPLDPAFTSFLLMAEAVEVFSASQNLGWDCGAGNGEGLSRVLATALYPTEIQKPGLATAGVWLDSNRPNWVNRNANTDQDAVVNGCDVLFLNYLRYQLGYSWNLIVGAAAPTLAKTYRTLTGKKSAFAPFKSLLDRHFPPGQPSNLMTDNPFPLQ